MWINVPWCWVYFIFSITKWFNICYCNQNYYICMHRVFLCHCFNFKNIFSCLSLFWILYIMFSFANLTLPYNFTPSVNLLNDSWPEQPQKKPRRIKVVHKLCMRFINIKKKIRMLNHIHETYVFDILAILPEIARRVSSHY